jgi:hypothetical protein
MSSNLDDILNDALNDFDFEDTTKAAIKPIATTKPAETSETSDSERPSSVPTPTVPTTSSTPLADDSDETKWAEEFLAKMGSEGGDLKKMMEEMQNAFRNSSSDTSSGAASSSSSMPLPNMPDLDFDSPEMKMQIEKLQEMLSQVEAGDESEEALDRILDATGMADMMKHLMSKEVLLEPFQEMDTQYKTWFKANTNIPDADLTRFKQQHELVQKIISCYTAQGDSATEIVAGLISEMQALGDPPQGMLQNMLPDMKFDENGKPVL